MENDEIKTGIIISGKRYTIEEAKETYNFLKQFFGNDQSNYRETPCYPYEPIWKYRPDILKWEVT